MHHPVPEATALGGASPCLCALMTDSRGSHRTVSIGWTSKRHGTSIPPDRVAISADFGAMTS
jgi:hypothetical protein